MKRPFKDKRPFGPVFPRSYSDDSEMGVLMARRHGNPELKMEIQEGYRDIDEDIFELFNERARFDAQNILVGKEEGEIGTTEPAITTVQIIAQDKEVNIVDINHFIDVMESEFTVFETKMAASVEVDPDTVPNPFEGTEFIEEPTDIED
jgi:hypothetical protein